MPAPVQTPVERAVVIGCGGVLGIAWSAGVLAGLAREGANVCDADLWVGASAGSVVSARLASGLAPATLYAEQINGQAAANEVLRPYSQSAVDASNQTLFDKVRGDLRQARQRIGAYALRSDTPSVEARRRIIAERLEHGDWPARRLLIVSVNAHDGDARILDRHSGVPLIDAVAASCAVPGVWPPVPLDGEHFMDGGVRSMTNADLAAGARRVLVLSPQGYSDGNPVSGHLRSELRALRAAGSDVHVIEPHARCREVIGPNILDPSRCAQVATEAMRQGQSLAGVVSSFWTSQPAYARPTHSLTMS